MAKNITLREVNARVDQLSAEFQNGFKEFKSEFAAKFECMPESGVNTANKKFSDFLAKFEKFEAHINSALSLLKNDVQCLKEQVDSLNSKCKYMELKSYYNYIIVHGLEESGENVYDNLLKLINRRLFDVNSENATIVKKVDINRCYRLGKKDLKKPRPLAVQFSSQWMRDLVFFKKKLLKGSKIMFTEFLTNENLKLFKMAKNIMGKSTWTFRGNVYAGNQDNKVLLRDEGDLNKLHSSGQASTSQRGIGEDA